MTYDYLCTTCQHRFEVQHGMNDPGPANCPACKAGTCKKQISKGTTFRLKGGGWADSGYGGVR